MNFSEHSSLSLFRQMEEKLWLESKSANKELKLSRIWPTPLLARPEEHLFETVS